MVLVTGRFIDIVRKNNILTAFIDMDYKTGNSPLKKYTTATRVRVCIHKQSISDFSDEFAGKIVDVNIRPIMNISDRAGQYYFIITSMRLHSN
jgi:hypothetical protein